MPRRPRPAHRPPKSNATGLQHRQARQSKAQVAKQARPKAVDFLTESEGSEAAQDLRSTVERVHKTSIDKRDEESEESEEEIIDEEHDFDAPRVAQWIDDDDEFEVEEESDGSMDSGSGQSDDEQESENEAGPSRRLQSLQDDLSTLPLGTLRNAQRSLAQAQALRDSESDSEDPSEGDFSASEDGEPSPVPAKGKGKEKLDQSPKPKKDVAKRTNKHAPVEMTSKRPVSRRRVVVEDKLPKPRDPRFVHATGQYDPSKFKQQYDFLSGMHSDELKTLREHVKRARKLLATSPPHLRAEREAEIERLELAMKRAESAVNQDKRERVEAMALQSAKREEMEKRQKGKAGWWMKQSERKELLDKARLDAIGLVGGKRAMKKAVEKKQKKISQKEKRSRPFLRNGDAAISAGSAGKRRRPVRPVDTEPAGKRRRVV